MEILSSPSPQPRGSQPDLQAEETRSLPPSDEGERFKGNPYTTPPPIAPDYLSLVTTPAKITGPPFYPTENICQLVSSDAPVALDAVAMINKGFFVADNDWTCYRRNYFSVACGIRLEPECSDPVYLCSPDGVSQHEIVDFAVTIAAATDPPWKRIELVQHTPKRDKGPQDRPARAIVNPLKDGSSETSETLLSFERLQFKHATANNGKRRASQEYFAILVEVWAKIRSISEPWTLIATRKSAPVVVRGRSPGHYSAGITGNIEAVIENPAESIYHPGSILQAYLNTPTSANFLSGGLRIESEGPGSRQPPGRDVEENACSWPNIIELDDNSSISSGSDFFSGTALSSVSSTSIGPSHGEHHLADLLLQDEGMKALCVDGFAYIDPDRFERNLRRLLKHYSAALIRESTQEIESKACKFVRSRARHTAGAIRSIVDPESIRRAQMMEIHLAEQSKSTQDVQQCLQRQEFETVGEGGSGESSRIKGVDTNSDSSGSENESDLDQLALPMPNLEHIKIFMTSSNAFEDLREGLMEFVISPQVISPLSTDTQLAIKAEVDEFRSARKSIAQSGEQSEGSFGDLINGLCEQLIGQCTKSSTRRFQSIVVSLYEFQQTSKVLLEILGPTKLWTPKEKEVVRPVFGQALDELAAVENEIKMAETKLLQERYQWKADPRTTPSGKMNSPIKTREDPTKHPSSTLAVVDLPRADEIFQRRADDPEILQSLQRRSDRLISLISDIKGVLLYISSAKSANLAVENSTLPIQDPILNPTQSINCMITIPALATFLWSEMIRLWTRISRPRVKKGFRRIEWLCDCGSTIYGDFDNSDSQAVNDFAKVLQSPNSAGTTASSTDYGTGGSSIPHSIAASEIAKSSQTTSSQPENHPEGDNVSNPAHAALDSQPPGLQPYPSKYLALCVNTGGIYKTLGEIEVSAVRSDGHLFNLMKKTYHDLRGFRTKFNFLIKPVEIQFVLFNLWNIREGFISICDKPKSIPPTDTNEYEYTPRPLVPLPPMPSEVFLHYLEHDDKDLCLTKSVWTPRLPLRLHKRIIECDIPTYGWGIHVIEGPNRSVVFWIVITAIFGSILACILWSSLRNDIQGGIGIGTLIIAVPPVIMTAFLFRLSSL